MYGDLVGDDLWSNSPYFGILISSIQKILSFYMVFHPILFNIHCIEPFLSESSSNDNLIIWIVLIGDSGWGKLGPLILMQRGASILQ